MGSGGTVRGERRERNGRRGGGRRMGGGKGSAGPENCGAAPPQQPGIHGKAKHRWWPGCEPLIGREYWIWNHGEDGLARCSRRGNRYRWRRGPRRSKKHCRDGREFNEREPGTSYGFNGGQSLRRAVGGDGGPHDGDRDSEGGERFESKWWPVIRTRRNRRSQSRYRARLHSGGITASHSGGSGWRRYPRRERYCLRWYLDL